MFEISPGQATPALSSLQRTDGHAYRRAFTVLDGAGAGRILTDDSDAPSWTAVHEHSDSGTLFLTGSLSRDVVATLISDLSRDFLVSVGLAPADPLLALLPTDWDEDRADIDFEDRSPAVDLATWIVAPDGFRLARIDHDLLHRCAWGPWMCASLETALDHGLGYCLLAGEEVIAEAFAGPVVDGVLEMGTITHAAYRRRGLGYQTWWNTSRTNTASAALARRLGYRTERRYRVWRWSRSPSP